MSDDPGTKEMLSFLIARDTMHQNQWMAVLEELKDMGMPVPSDFPQEQENQEFSYEFLVHSDGEVPDDARWTSGSSVDSKGKFGVREAEPMGDVPKLAPAGGATRDAQHDRTGQGRDSAQSEGRRHALGEQTRTERKRRRQEV